jgi:hypothetical protein
MNPLPIIHQIKRQGLLWVKNKLQGRASNTRAGSIAYLLYGEIPSFQSINIKMGHFGEYLIKELIKTNPELHLLLCGKHLINGKNIDVDLLFMNETTKTIYYRELKGNIELDTEKIPSTINKCKEIETALKNQYSDYNIDFGILNWSVYNRRDIHSGLSNIKAFETKGVKINHIGDFLEIIGIVWDETDYYDYFREIGNRILTNNYN